MTANMAAKAENRASAIELIAAAQPGFETLFKEAVAAVRRFNRFYTRFVGALEPRFLGSEMSLVEARALYEIATRDAPIASDLQAELGIDAGYLSRIVRRLQGRGRRNGS